MTPHRTGIVLATMVLFLALGLTWAGGGPPNFDKLSEADKVDLAKRFEKEVWPLLNRNGKDGCVGCHTKSNNGLKFAGTPEKSFRLLVKDGFFLKDDAGSIVARLYDKDQKRKMPPPKALQWTEEERKQVRAFTEEVNRREKK